jgi:Carboxypeptidase C (cathepsin A)
MRKWFLTLSACIAIAIVNAQAPRQNPAAAAAAREERTAAEKETPASPSRTLNPDHQVVTEHEVTIKGQKVPYRVTTGTQPVWDDDGKVIAAVFYIYYERTDVKDKAPRPLVISFNGGPGTASVWMHIAYTGPKLLKIDDEGYPIQPYGFKDNPHSILEVADLLYIDPVNTGFSRIIDKKVERSKFFGTNADIKYLADWINTFVSRANRWASPKFLIGESYGTTRVSGLALELQNAHWMYLNGVILVSPTDLGIDRSGPVAAAMKLPYYAATAWYHKQLEPALQGKDLLAVLPEVEEFTLNELIPALARGGFLEESKKKAIAQKIARYSGLPEKIILQNNLVVSPQLFWKELLREEGYTVGRLDSRYLGIDRREGGESPDFNSELTTWLHAFTPPINMYLREELKYKTDLKYYIVWPRRIPGTGAMTAPVKTCARPWPPILTSKYLFKAVIMMAPAIISMPSMICGISTQVVN